MVLPTGGAGGQARESLSQQQVAELRSSVNIKSRNERLFTQYRSRSLFCLDRTNPLRRAVILTIESKWFEGLVLLVILVNTAFLAAFDPTQGEDSPRNSFLDKADLVFNGLYTAEMLLKIVAMGFVMHPFAYLRDAWNRFDFVIVVIGWATYFLSQLKGASALRAFRVLRTLKTIRGLKAMRLLVVSIINSLPSLGNILVLYFFMFVIFGIAGVQLWVGNLNQRCEASDVIRSPWTLGVWNATELCDIAEQEADDRVCSTSSSGGRQCPPLHTCVDAGEAPNYGITSFNNLAAAMLTLFQCVTLEGWTDVMYMVQDSFSGWAWIYFVTLIIFGAFFVVNLALAVMYGKFTQITEEIELQTAERKVAKAVHRQSVAAAMQRQSVALARASVVVSDPSGGPQRRERAASHESTNSTQTRATEMSVMSTPRSTAPMLGDKQDAGGKKSVHLSPDALRDVEMSEAIAAQVAEQTSTQDDDGNTADDGEPKPPSNNAFVVGAFNFVCHPGFRTFILLVIIANTVVLAIDHNQMSEKLESDLNIANTVFSAIFIFECVVKIIGLGPRGYISDRFNVFDFLVVLLSIVEFFLLGGGGGGAFSVLRAFRLLRVFKLARSWPNLQHLIAVILSSMGLLSHCMMLMLLFVTIFAVVGMQLFGGKLRFEEDGEIVIPRAHFDNFYWACITVFQVMSGENWNEAMYDGIRATHWIAASYYVVVVLVGSYIILTLVQVVLLNKFSSDDIHGIDALTQRSVTIGAIGDVIATTGKAAVELTRVSAKKTAQVGKSVATRARRSPRGSKDIRRDSEAEDLSASVASVASSVADDGGASDSDANAPGSSQYLQPATGRSGSGVLPLSSEDSSHSDDDDLFTAIEEHIADIEVHEERRGSTSPQDVTPQTNGDDDDETAVTDDAVTAEDYPEPGHRSSAAQPFPSTPVARDSDDGERKESIVEDEKDTNAVKPSGIQITVAEPVIGRRSDAPRQKWNSVDSPHDSHVSTMSGFTEDPDDPHAAGEFQDATDDGFDEAQEMHRSTTAATADEDEEDVRPVERSLFLFQYDNPFRVWMQRVVFHPLFEGFIMAMILFSSVLLAIEYPRMDPNGNTKKFLDVMDIVFLVLFACEMGMKVIALGLVLHKNSYLRGSVWNKLDAFVVLVSFLNLILPYNLKFLRALRALRPLRLVGRHAGMKVVVKSLSKSLPAIFQVFLLGLLFWLIFSILGVQFFAGKFYSCTDPSITTRVECIGEFKPDHCPFLPANHTTVPEEEPRRWVTAQPNFDNVAYASLALFEVATLEMWPDIMANAVDGVDYDNAPRRDHNPAAALFFVLFLMICSFFVLNLLVGVVIDNFNKVRYKYNGSAFLTKAQRDWVAVQKIMIRHRPVKQYAEAPKQKWRQSFFYFVTSNKFEALISVIIIVNMAFLGSRHYNQEQYWTDTLVYSNIVFTSIYILEAILKIIGLGVKQYFENAWNRFDMLIVVISVAGLAFSFSFGASVLRSLRVIRVFKLLKSAENLTSLLVALISALPTLSNVGSLLFLVFFVYAVAGVSLFGEVKFGDFITDRSNFTNFWHALLLLFRMVTGESWNGVMHDAEVQPPDCTPDVDCGVRFAWIYFVSFEMVAFFVMANLFVAVVLESFADMTNDVALDLSSKDFAMFSRTWSKYDAKSTYYLDPDRFEDFLRDLGPPLGIRADTSSRDARRVIFNLDIPLYDGQLFYKDVLLSLARKNLDREATELPEGKATTSIEKKWSRKYKMPTVQSIYSVQTLIAVKRIQLRWRLKAARLARERREREAKLGVKPIKRRSSLAPPRKSVGGFIADKFHRFTSWVKEEDAKNLAQAHHVGTGKAGGVSLADPAHTGSEEHDLARGSQS